MLEKILEEIEKEFDRRIDTQLKIMAGLNDDVYRYGYGKSLEAYQQGKLLIEDIIRKHINDGWIPCEERLPEENEINFYDTVIVQLKGGRVSVGFYRSTEKVWYVEKENDSKYIIDNDVLYWQPLPEEYRPEKGVTDEKETD